MANTFLKKKESGEQSDAHFCKAKDKRHNLMLCITFIGVSLYSMEEEKIDVRINGLSGHVASFEMLPDSTIGDVISKLKEKFPEKDDARITHEQKKLPNTTKLSQLPDERGLDLTAVFPNTSDEFTSMFQEIEDLRFKVGINMRGPDLGAKVNTLPDLYVETYSPNEIKKHRIDMGRLASVSFSNPNFTFKIYEVSQAFRLVFGLAEKILELKDDLLGLAKTLNAPAKYESVGLKGRFTVHEADTNNDNSQRFDLCRDPDELISIEIESDQNPNVQKIGAYVRDCLLPKLSHTLE